VCLICTCDAEVGVNLSEEERDDVGEVLGGGALQDLGRKRVVVVVVRQVVDQACMLVCVCVYVYDELV
jgi:hypothetical protein